MPRWSPVVSNRGWQRRTTVRHARRRHCHPHPYHCRTDSRPTGGAGHPSPTRPDVDPAEARRRLHSAEVALLDERTAAHRRGVGRPGRAARRVGHLAGRTGPPGPSGLVRARRRGRGHPVGQDRRLSRGLPLLLAVVPLRLTGQGHSLPGHRRGPGTRRARPRRPAPPSSASCWPSAAPTSAPWPGSSSWSPSSTSRPGSTWR